VPHLGVRRRFAGMSPRKIIVIVGVPIICLIGVLAIPNFTRPRVTAAPRSCVAQLRMIDGMKNQWALEHHKTTNDSPTWDDLRSYWSARDPFPLQCPEGGVYTIGQVGVMPSCSLTRHNESGRTNGP
jgi:hypothetical protein